MSESVSRLLKIEIRERDRESSLGIEFEFETEIRLGLVLNFRENKKYINKIIYIGFQIFRVGFGVKN